MKNVLLLSAMLIALGLLFLGCAKSMLANLEGVKGHTGSIRILANQTSKEVPSTEPAMKEIAGHTIAIDSEVETATASFSAEKERLAKSVETEKAKNKKLAADLAKEKESGLAMVRKLTATIIVASGLAVGVSLFMFFMGNLKSLSVTVAALAVCGSAIALQVALSYLIWIALGFGLIVATVVGYWAYKHGKVIKASASAAD